MGLFQRYEEMGFLWMGNNTFRWTAAKERTNSSFFGNNKSTTKIISVLTSIASIVGSCHCSLALVGVRSYEYLGAVELPSHQVSGDLRMPHQQ